MPSVSSKQQKLMGMALAAKRGQLTKPSAEVSKVASGMSESQLRDFAKKPKHHKTPMRHR